MDGQEMLAHDMQTRIRQKMMDVGDAPDQGILDRNDAEIAAAGLHRFDRVFKTGMGNGGGMRDRFARRLIGIGARFALKGNALGMVDRSGHESIFRAK